MTTTSSNNHDADPAWLSQLAQVVDKAPTNISSTPADLEVLRMVAAIDYNKNAALAELVSDEVPTSD